MRILMDKILKSKVGFHQFFLNLKIYIWKMKIIQTKSQKNPGTPGTWALSIF